MCVLFVILCDLRFNSDNSHMHATGLRSACALAQARPTMSCIHLVIKPVTGIERMCSASLKTTRTLIILGFHKEKEVCQHSHSSDPSSGLHNTCNMLQYNFIALHNILVCQIKCTELYCTMSYCYTL